MSRTTNNAKKVSTVLLMRTNVNGLSHHDYALCAKQIEVADELRLVPQPENRHDNEAVAVYLDDQQIGWIPMAAGTAKGVVQRLLLADCDVKAHVVSHDMERGNLDQRLYVQVRVRID